MSSTMDGLGALATAASLAPNVYSSPEQGVTVPAILIDYPSTIDFDMVFSRGGDRAVHPVWYIPGDGTPKETRDALSTMLADSSSVKSAFDGAQSFGSVRVTDAEIARIAIGAITYTGVKYSVEVYS